jgi:hypothetical protein
MFNTVAPAVDINAILPDPKEITLVKALDEVKIPVDHVKVTKFNVPVRYDVLEVVAVVKLLPNVQAPPEPLKVTVAAFIVILLVVIVLPVAVELKVKVPVADHTVEALNVILPATKRLPVLVNVTVPADTVISKQFKVPVIVTV